MHTVGSVLVGVVGVLAGVYGILYSRCLTMRLLISDIFCR